MKAAVLRHAGQPLSIERVAIDKPGPREVLVRTRAVGLCHSDLHFIDGAYQTALPAILGHEAAGVVEAVGEAVRTVRPGDHVVMCLSVFCGHCDHCLTGHMNLCVSPETKRSGDETPRLGTRTAPLTQTFSLSAFAEQMLVHEHACVPIRRDMPLDRAALIGCSVMTGIGAVTRTSNVQMGETVAVIGCGGVGLSAINGAALIGAGRIIAIDRVAGKEALAREFGATDFIDASRDDPVEAVRAVTGGGVHHAFEAIGLTATAEQAFAMLRRGGTANVIGLIPKGEMIRIGGNDLLGEKRLQGSLMGSNRAPVDVPRLVDLYLAGSVKLDQLISARLPLERINEGFTAMRTGEIARTVIVFD